MEFGFIIPDDYCVLSETPYTSYMFPSNDALILVMNSLSEPQTEFKHFGRPDDMYDECRKPIKIISKEDILKKIPELSSSVSYFEEHHMLPETETFGLIETDEIIGSIIVPKENIEEFKSAIEIADEEFLEGNKSDVQLIDTLTESIYKHITSENISATMVKSIAYSISVKTLLFSLRKLPTVNESHSQLIIEHPILLKQLEINRLYSDIKTASNL